MAMYIVYLLILCGLHHEIIVCPFCLAGFQTTKEAIPTHGLRRWDQIFEGTWYYKR